MFVSLFVLIYINRFTCFLTCLQDTSDVCSSMITRLERRPCKRRYPCAGARKPFQINGPCETLSLTPVKPVKSVIPICLCVSVFMFLTYYVCL